MRMGKGTDTGEVASARSVGPGPGVCGHGDWSAQVGLGRPWFCFEEAES